jgi:hypothetical protein
MHADRVHSYPPKASQPSVIGNEARHFFEPKLIMRQRFYEVMALEKFTHLR